MKTSVSFAVIGCVSGIDVHPDRLAQIKEIESTPGVLWKAVPHARFAAQAPGAFSTMNGLVGNQTEIVLEKLASGELKEVQHDEKAALPESFDSAENWPQCAEVIGDIRDQSNCGCCWAFAGASAASDRMCIATNASMKISLSAQDVCFNGGLHVGSILGGCSGGNAYFPWAMLRKGALLGGQGAVSGGQYNGTGAFGKGLCSDFSMPHCHHHGPQGDDPYPAEGAPGCPNQKSPPGSKKCDAAAVPPHNDYAADKYSYEGTTVTARGEKAMMQALYEGGPLEVSYIVFSDFENYQSGIYHHVTGLPQGGHAVKLVGWGVENDVKYWKIANSWNPHWGEKGYFRIKRGDNEGLLEVMGALGSAPDAKWSRAADSSSIVV